jgi:hypothetical protein
MGLVAGALVGPAAIVMGTGGYKVPLWAYGFNAETGTEVIDRIGIAYVGYKPSDGSHWSLATGGYIGTVGLVAGYAAHKAAGLFGWNRTVARYRWGKYLTI